MILVFRKTGTEAEDKTQRQLVIRKYKVVVALKSVSRWVTLVVSRRRFYNLVTDNGTKRAYREWNTAFGDGPKHK